MMELFEELKAMKISPSCPVCQSREAISHEGDFVREVVHTTPNYDRFVKEYVPSKIFVCHRCMTMFTIVFVHGSKTYPQYDES